MIMGLVAPWQQYEGLTTAMGLWLIQHGVVTVVMGLVDTVWS